jgi:hypothetical protein
MSMDPDAIAVKFAELENLRLAIGRARGALTHARETQKSFTTGAENQDWDDEAYQAKLTSFMRTDTVGTEIEEALNRTEEAVNRTEEQLRSVVVSTKNSFV